MASRNWSMPVMLASAVPRPPGRRVTEPMRLDAERMKAQMMTSIQENCIPRPSITSTKAVPLFEGFRRHHLRTVLATHELAASFMANGYYRATGRAAALATIPGPGFTYALTGLAEARLDSAALVYLVGMPATKPGRAFQLQSIDQETIAGPLVKRVFSFDVRERRRAGHLRRARARGERRARAGDGSNRRARSWARDDHDGAGIRGEQRGSAKRSRPTR